MSEQEFDQSPSASSSSGQREIGELEGALEEIQKQLEKGSLKTRSTKAEVESRRRVLEQAQEALRSAVKAKERLGKFDGANASVRKKAARALAEQAAELEVEDAIEEAEESLRSISAELEAEAAEAVEEEGEIEVEEEPHPVLAGLNSALKEAQGGLQEHLPPLLGESGLLEGESGAKLSGVIGGALEHLYQAAAKQVKEAARVVAFKEEEVNAFKVENAAVRIEKKELQRELATVQSDRDRLAAEVAKLRQEVAEKEFGSAPGPLEAALREELRRVQDELKTLQGASKTGSARAGGGGAAEENEEIVLPVRGDSCWTRPRRLLEEYTASLIEGTPYFNGVQLWRRTSPVDITQREGELLTTYPLLTRASCADSSFEELEYSLPVVVGLQDVLRHLESGSSICTGGAGHALLDEAQDLLSSRAGYLLELALCNRDEHTRRQQGASGAISLQLATKSPAEVRADWSYQKSQQQSTTVIPQSDEQRSADEDRREIYRRTFTQQLVKEQTRQHVAEITKASRFQGGRTGWQAKRGGGRPVRAPRGGRGAVGRAPAAAGAASGQDAPGAAK